MKPTVKTPLMPSSPPPGTYESASFTDFECSHPFVVDSKRNDIIVSDTLEFNTLLPESESIQVAAAVLDNEDDNFVPETLMDEVILLDTDDFFDSKHLVLVAECVVAPIGAGSSRPYYGPLASEKKGKMPVGFGGKKRDFDDVFQDLIGTMIPAYKTLCKL